ncbi:MAG: DNA cytosine methyltransferase [Candidatus Spyradosoma sp.]
MKTHHSLVDLFAGCGGLSLGMEQAGFTPVFANEIWEPAATTYRMNRALTEKQIFVGDIHYLVEHLVDFKLPKEVDLVCGGPPCQGFSMANRQRLIDDPRNHLYKVFLRFLSQIRPFFFVMENVRGMAGRIDEILDNFRSALGDEYSFAYSLLNAADFGVPQNRVRFILIGNRIGVGSQAIFDKLRLGVYQKYVLRDVLDGLPKLGHKETKGLSDEESDKVGYFKCPFTYVKNEFFKYINGGRAVDFLFNHKNRYNNPRDIEIYSRLPQGGNSLHPSIADIMPYTRRNGIFKDKYFKLEEDRICKTITSHMKFDCNMYIHPWYARGLTAREASRIQTFPDDFIFYGAQNSWYGQIGNAVPVKLAYAIGSAIIKHL